METFLAHSAQHDNPAQTNESHIRGVCEKALQYVREAAPYSTNAKELLTAVVRESAVFHDFGKLDD